MFAEGQQMATNVAINIIFVNMFGIQKKDKKITYNIIEIIPIKQGKMAKLGMK